MRIVAAAGANLRPAEIDRYRVHVLPTRIMVDGVEHDTRTPYPLSAVDGWVRGAKVHPYNVGATAAELIESLRKESASDSELLLVMPTRKIIGSYQAAVSAERALKGMASTQRVKVAILELGATDGAGALAVTYAGEAKLAGLSFDEVVAATQAFIAGTRVIIVPRVLDYLVKGGRATFLRATVANLLDQSPIIGFDDGEMKSIGKTKRSEAIAAIAGALEAELRGRRVWLGITHGGCERDAGALAAEIERRLRVEYTFIRTCSPTTYLHLGPQALAAFAAPVDKLPWLPPPPALG